MRRFLIVVLLALGLANGAVAQMVTAGPSGSNLNSRPTLYNYSPAMLPKWRVALAKATAGTGRAKLADLGDSLVAGAGSGTAGTALMTGARINAVPSQLKAFFNGVTAQDENAFGNALTPDAGTAAITAFDPRVTFAGTTWTPATTYSLGGKLWLSTTGTDAITFTPTTAIGKCDIPYVQGTSFGTFTVNDSTGVLATVNAAGSSAFLKVTVSRTGADSTNPVWVQRSTGGTLYISGFDCYPSSKPGVSIYNLGEYGATTGVVADTTSPWSTANAIPVLAPDLTLIQLGTNDIRQNVPVATAIANLQLLITKAQLSGDAILVWRWPDNASVNPSLVQPYHDAMLALAISNGIPLLDLSERFVSYAASSSLYYDGVHLLKPGYSDVARAEAAMVQP